MGLVPVDKRTSAILDRFKACAKFKFLSTEERMIFVMGVAGERGHYVTNENIHQVLTGFTSTKYDIKRTLDRLVEQEIISQVAFNQYILKDKGKFEKYGCLYSSLSRY